MISNMKDDLQAVTESDCFELILCVVEADAGRTGAPIIRSVCE